MEQTVKSHSPVILFVYNRSFHTLQTLKSLLNNQESQYSDLYVYSDGPKKIEDIPAIENVRKLFRDLKGFKSVTLIEREKNFGLAKNIIAGVTEVCQKHGRVIVLEDDLVLSPHFLRFMNENLHRYENVPEVGSIHGYVIPTKHPLPDAFFLRGADCWGWATWQRSWSLFEKDGNQLLQKLFTTGLASGFDMNGLAGNLAMLRDQIAGKNNSWAIRWHASLYLENKLTLYPGVSLVDNIGNDNSGEHCISTNVYKTSIAKHPILVDKDIPLLESEIGLIAYHDFFKQLNPPFLKRAIRKMKRILTDSVF